MFKSCWWGPSWPRQTHYHRRITGQGLGACEGFSTLSSCLELRCLVRSGRGSSVTSPLGIPPRSQRDAGDGIGRHLGTAPGRKDPREGHLPRPRALFPQLCGQSQRASVVEPDAVGPHYLGQARVGFALLDRAGPIRALPSGAEPAPQEADRLGAAHAPGGTTLGTQAQAGAGYR
jgi:hypothetical protein